MVDELICLVYVVEVYVCVVEFMGLNMILGYLYRLLGKNKLLVLDGYLFYLVVYERLMFYLEKLDIDEGEIFIIWEEVV